MVVDPPATRAPGITSCIRLSVRSTVVLPQPDGPMNAVIWWLWICRVTPRTARNAP